MLPELLHLLLGELEASKGSPLPTKSSHHSSSRGKAQTHVQPRAAVGFAHSREVLNDNPGLLGKLVPSASPAGSRGTNPAKPILLPTHPLLLLFCSSYCWNNMWIYFPTCTPLSCSWRHLPVTERQASFTAFITKSSVPPHTSTLTRAT